MRQNPIFQAMSYKMILDNKKTLVYGAPKYCAFDAFFSKSIACVLYSTIRTNIYINANLSMKDYNQASFVGINTGPYYNFG